MLAMLSLLARKTAAALMRSPLTASAASAAKMGFAFYRQVMKVRLKLAA
jgi:hypothetical protein